MGGKLKQFVKEAALTVMVSLIAAAVVLGVIYSVSGLLTLLCDLF